MKRESRDRERHRRDGRRKRKETKREEVEEVFAIRLSPTPQPSSNLNRQPSDGPDQLANLLIDSSRLNHIDPYTDLLNLSHVNSKDYGDCDLGLHR